MRNFIIEKYKVVSFLASQNPVFYHMQEHGILIDGQVRIVDTLVVILWPVEDDCCPLPGIGVSGPFQIATPEISWLPRKVIEARP